MGTVVDRRGGELRRTGGPLDLAIVGEGRFVVQTATGEELVRSAAFTLDGEGQIIDADGRALMGEGGVLVLPPGPVEIDAKGRVSVAGEAVGRLRVVRAEDPALTSGAVGSGGAEPTTPDGPARAGAVGEAAAADLAPLSEEEVLIRQGYLEGSNVSALDSLIEMTTIQRAFQAVSDSVQALDSVRETVANRLGRLE